ncbi:hypothetical protein GCK72_020513 [Caenorhabditis remanei]|uniref:C-type lectin domain-containing protein n=1 Tax=Caenorhabditis remanei TaxID=31234 RepID=A0A6A5GH13_CAERE|nr:hypothetical protein GCK72_020513 [Caenorhabditis remanei]KAF1753956.1 hypothetical protein GCK72_020513 [Caenorhabditis remanei]
MNSLFFISLLFSIFYAKTATATCSTNFTPFQGLNYALIPTNADWDTSLVACQDCGADMMGMPYGDNKTFVEQTLGVNTVAWDTAWVNIKSDGWCSFYTFKSNKQFFGTNCESTAAYVLCVKN